MHGRRAWCRRRMGGFLLIEAGLVLLILVLAAGLVTLLLGRHQQRRRCDRFAADLRTFAEAFQEYAPPGDASLPAGLEDRLKDTNWRKGSPFGGDYGCLASPPVGPSADGAGRSPARGGAIVLTAFAPSMPLTLSRRDLLYIDATIDDANLATGRFRTGFNGWPVYDIGENQ
ncbi:MAG: hypothetical protein PHQ04_12055 [Opitutaceae bacterium]|nr:hypothetical protein [Opitutaceae bacterium]